MSRIADCAEMTFDCSRKGFIPIQMINDNLSSSKIEAVILIYFFSWIKVPLFSGTITIGTSHPTPLARDHGVLACMVIGNTSLRRTALL